LAKSIPYLRERGSVLFDGITESHCVPPCYFPVSSMFSVLRIFLNCMHVLKDLFPSTQIRRIDTLMTRIHGLLLFKTFFHILSCFVVDLSQLSKTTSFGFSTTRLEAVGLSRWICDILSCLVSVRSSYYLFVEWALSSSESQAPVICSHVPQPSAAMEIILRLEAGVVKVSSYTSLLAGEGQSLTNSTDLLTAVNQALRQVIKLKQIADNSSTFRSNKRISYELNQFFTVSSLCLSC
jgi:hypothetical protein